MAFGFMAVNGIGTWTGLKAKKVVKAKKERPWTVFSSIVRVFCPGTFATAPPVWHSVLWLGTLVNMSFLGVSIS